MDDHGIESLPQPNPRQRRITRLLLLIWLALGIVVALLICYIAFSAFRQSSPPPIQVGTLDQFPLGSINKVFVNADFFDDTENKQIQTLPLQVVRDANGTFTVFFARSTGRDEAVLIPGQCIVDWDDSLKTFLELCGGSQWSREGKYVAGPAPRDLDRFPSHVENNTLFIDLNLIKGATHS